QMHCHIDFRDFYRGSLSLRRIAVMIRWLPDSSAVNTLARDGFPEWSATAQVVDDLRRVFLMSKQVKDPAPHPMSPLAALNRHLASQNAEKQAAAWAVSKNREEARQVRLA